jgi:hypothetical protein
MDKQQALGILRALANGIDPVTGEVLPADGPCQRADTVRALVLAVERVERWTERTLPEGAGRRWDSEEEGRLVKAYRARRPIREIAADHSRTTGAIRSRLRRLGLLD